LYVGGERHAGHQAKVLRNSVELELVDAAVRLVVRRDGLIVLIRGERTLADPQHLSFGDAVLDIVECIDFDQTGIAPRMKPMSRVRKCASASTGAFRSINVNKV